MSTNDAPVSLFDLPHDAARRLVQSGAPVYLFVNPVEYHGPHLPLHNDRIIAHGIARDRFDGDDVVKVKRRIAEAVERARTTGEPTLVEVVTYRFRGHSMSDPGLYRTKDEVEEWKRRDPLSRSRQRLLDIGFPEADLATLEDEVKAEIEDAVKFAEESPPADEYLQYVVKE